MITAYDRRSPIIVALSFVHPGMEFHTSASGAPLPCPCLLSRSIITRTRVTAKAILYILVDPSSLEYCLFPSRLSFRILIALICRCLSIILRGKFECFWERVAWSARSFCCRPILITLSLEEVLTSLIHVQRHLAVVFGRTRGDETECTRNAWVSILVWVLEP
jgi:hypothetical protein